MIVVVGVRNNISKQGLCQHVGNSQ
jgi:hypothetical protein